MALLEVAGLTAFYHDFQALRGVSMSIDAGQIVAVIGANGAGKSTLLNSIAGLIRVDRSCIRLDGEATGGLRPSSLVARGISLVPEGRRLFPSLSVEENLLIGGHLRRKGPWNLERIFATVRGDDRISQLFEHAFTRRKAVLIVVHQEN